MLLLPLLAAHIMTTGTLIPSQPQPPAEQRPQPRPAAEVAKPPALAPVAASAVSEEGFRTGIDTLATVTAKLGRPNMTEANSDGTVTVRYSSVKTRVKGTTFIPIVGMFVGGAKGTSSVRSFTFGGDGRLKSFATGDFQTKCSVFGGCH